MKIRFGKIRCCKMMYERQRNIASTFGRSGGGGVGTVLWLIFAQQKWIKCFSSKRDGIFLDNARRTKKQLKCFLWKQTVTRRAVFDFKETKNVSKMYFQPRAKNCAKDRCPKSTYLHNNVPTIHKINFAKYLITNHLRYIHTHIFKIMSSVWQK
jgi:hypothetical protein